MRPKLYYSDSEIEKGLYTFGKEYMYQNGIEYTGYYHKYSDGLVMTESIYDPLRSKILTVYTNNPLQIVYDRVSKVSSNIKQYQTLLEYFPVPNIDDYNNGSFKRYFYKRIDSTSIIEISEASYELYLNGNIDNIYYQVTDLIWKLTGPVHDNMNNNNIVHGVYDTNKRTVELKSKTFKGLNNKLQNFLEFYKK